MEYTTEAGHMRVLPKSVRSTTSSTDRGRPKNNQLDIERDAAADEITVTPEQVQGNKKTNLVIWLLFWRTIV